MSGTIANWLGVARNRSQLRVEHVPMDACNRWRWDGALWRHDQDRFFSVVGVVARIGGERLVEQPMVHQPEVGVLGFIVRRDRRGRQWLLQAKTEPGNVGGTQVGPSAQATLSNYQRVHGGRPTPMIEYFVGPAPAGCRSWADSLQSEQGDRFLAKYNRNVLVELDTDRTVVQDKNWAWFPAAVVRQALTADFVVNTDARSVVVCSPWEWLCDEGESTFSRCRGRDEFGEALFESLASPEGIEASEQIDARLDAARLRYRIEVTPVPITKLRGWRFDETGIHPVDKRASFSVQAYAVHARDREVTHWSQPLLVGARLAKVTLLCTRWRGILHCLLRYAPEPGFSNSVQLGPSDIDDPLHHRLPWMETILTDPGCVIRASVQQSDEGGRFIQSAVSYQVLESDPLLVPREDPDAIWLTMAQIQSLTRQSGKLTNEARSVLSLLLSWA